MSVAPLLTGVPSARVTVPRVGSPVTVMVRGSPSTSLGAVRPKEVSLLSSSMVRLLLLTTGLSFTALRVISVLPLKLTLPSSTL